MDRLCGDTCSYVCPPTWLNEGRINIGLFPTMGFFNENDSLAYLAILGELSSGLSFTVGFSRLCLLSLLVRFFRGQGRTHLLQQHSNVLVGLRKPNTRREIFWLSALNLKAYLTTATLAKPWTGFM